MGRSIEPARHRRTAARPPVLAAAIAALACAAAPAGAERLSIRTFTAADGLGSSFVNHVTQDATGYVWFATRDGLSRWNGYELVTLSETAGFSVPAIDRVYQTRSGEYYVICNDGSLHAFRPPPPGAAARDPRVVFRRVDLRVGGHDVFVTVLYEDANGLLWAGGHGVLIRGVGADNTAIPIAHAAAPPGAVVIVQAILEDRSGSLWVGTNWGLERLSDGVRDRHYTLARSAIGDSVTSLAQDPAGRIWIGHNRIGVVVLNARAAPGDTGDRQMPIRRVEGEAFRLDPREGEAVLLATGNGLPASDVTSLLATSDGRVWVGTGKGLARFDGASFSRYTKANGLCDNVIHALLEDADRQLWIATPTGAMRVAFEGFSGYTVDEGLATNRIASFARSPDGTVFAVGIDWSINWFDGRAFHASRLPVPRSSTLMWASQAAYLARDGHWWALTSQGLCRFAPPREAARPAFGPPERVFTTRDGLPSSHAFRVYQDRAGTLWVGTRSGDPADDGLARFDPARQRFIAIGPREGLAAPSAPSAFAEDRAGHLWIGFYRGGVARFRDGRFTTFGREDGFPDGMVTALLADRDGRLWVASNHEGIGRIDDPGADRPRVRIYRTRDGLSSNNVRALVEDRLGRLFAGTARGVDRLDPQSGRPRHYGADDGLSGDFITAAFRDASGTLWFGSNGGAFRFAPPPERPPQPPPIVITGLRVAGESRPLFELGQSAVGPIEFDADQRDVAIDFVSVSVHRARATAYEYSIDAGHGSWSAPTTARTVNFARLAPGAYRFAVRAVTTEGLASPRPATVAFTISPPIWRRWWAVSLGLGALAALLVGLYRVRVSRLLAVERLRTRIASDLHDEIATNLSSIAMFSTIVGSELREPSPLLGRITMLATDSVNAIRDIIWSIDPKPESVADLLVRLRDAMVTACRARGIQLTMLVPSEGTGRNLAPEQRQHLWLMLKEAVTNAVKHSGGSEVTVSVTPSGRRFRFVVRDNGRGGPEPFPASGRGLATMRSRAEALGGTMSIARGAAGTTVEFLLTLSE